MNKKPRVVIDPNLIASALIGGLTRDYFVELVSIADEIDSCYADELLTEVEALPYHTYFQQKGIDDLVVEKFVRFFIGFSLKVNLFKLLFKGEFVIPTKEESSVA